MCELRFPLLCEEVSCDTSNDRGSYKECCGQLQCIIFPEQQKSAYSRERKKEFEEVPKFLKGWQLAGKVDITHGAPSYMFVQQWSVLLGSVYSSGVAGSIEGIQSE
jgi:hypothetical protein